MGANESVESGDTPPEMAMTSEEAKKKAEEKRRKRQHSIAMRAIGNGSNAIFDTASDSSDDEDKKEKFEKRHPYIMIGFYVMLAMLSFTIPCLMNFTDVFEDYFRQKIILQNNATNYYNLWKNPPVEPKLKVHIFNYSNLDLKMNIEEVGTLNYKMSFKKFDVRFQDSLVSYREKLIFTPEKEESRDDNLRVMVPDPSGEKFLSGKLGNYWKFLQNVVQKFSGLKNVDLLEMITSKNSGNITIITGPDLENLGKIYSYNSNKNLGVWHNENCDEVRGNTIWKFSPKKLDEDQELFLPFLCRSLSLHRAEKMERVVESFPAARFKVTSDNFATPKVKCSNFCYCDEGKCPPNGVFSAGQCLDNLPIFISFPHFFHGNSSLLEPFEGLNPNENSHESFVDLNTRFGVPMNASMKFQLNLQLKKSETFIPICWFEMVVDNLPAVIWGNFNHGLFSINILYLYSSLFLMVVFMVSCYKVYDIKNSLKN